MADFYNNTINDTNNSSNIDNSDSDNNYDSDSDIDDINELSCIYDPEEPSNKKFTVILCKFIPHLSYHLVIIRFKLFNLTLINKFKNIMAYNNATIQISECIYLDTQECVAIIKTIWLKLIQRTWKKIYKIRKNIICMRKTPLSIFYREINGKWPSNCVNMPCLRGMISYLKK
jgi:hypothetical protein